MVTPANTALGRGPLRVLIWQEIVDDTVDGVSIAVTWCLLCNSSLVFDWRIDGRTLSFRTTGKLRNSDLVMYDRKTGSRWQQFGGECSVGALLGARLKPLPAQVESAERIRTRFPRRQGRIRPRRAAVPVLCIGASRMPSTMSVSPLPPMPSIRMHRSIPNEPSTGCAAGRGNVDVAMA